MSWSQICHLEPHNFCKEIHGWNLLAPVVIGDIVDQDSIPCQQLLELPSGLSPGILKLNER